MEKLKLFFIALFSILYFQQAHAFSAKFSCGPHGKSGADVDMVVITGSDPKNPTDTIEIRATVKKIKIGKAVYKNLNFKGERPYSARGPFFELDSDPPHKKIKSIFISSSASTQEIGQDEVITVDDVSHKMSCSEQ